MYKVMVTDSRVGQLGYDTTQVPVFLYPLRDCKKTGPVCSMNSNSSCLPL